MQSRGYKGVSPPSVLPDPGNAAAQQQPHVSISFTGTFGCAKPSNKRQRHNLSQNHSVISKNEVGRGRGTTRFAKSKITSSSPSRAVSSIAPAPYHPWASPCLGWLPCILVLHTPKHNHFWEETGHLKCSEITMRI